MAPGGDIANLLGGDGGALDVILNAANGLLCSNAGIKLSDISGMIDGSGSVGAMSTVRALSLMTTVRPQAAAAQWAAALNNASSSVAWL